MCNRAIHKKMKYNCGIVPSIIYAFRFNCSIKDRLKWNTTIKMKRILLDRSNEPNLAIALCVMWVINSDANH